MIKGQIIKNCQSDVVRSGIGSCEKKENKTLGLLVTSAKALYPMDQEQFKTALEGYVSETGVLRMTPINNIIANSPNGGDIATSEVGFSGPMPVGLNAFNEAYQVDAGDCFYKALVGMNKQKVRVFRMDDEGYLYGTVVTKDGVDYFAGFEGYIYTSRTKGSDNSTLAAITVTVYYTPNYANELKDLNAFEIGDIPEGLIGVTLKPGTSGAASVVSVCGGEDYTSMYGSDWAATMFVNETGVNPETVTFDAATGLLTFVPTGKYKVAAASMLKAGDILGLDGVNEYVTV